MQTPFLHPRLRSLLFLLAFASPLALHALPTDGLTAYWTFEGTLGNSALASGNTAPPAPSNLDLTASGGFSYNADGRFGQAARFNGTDAYLRIAGGGKVVDDNPLSDTTVSVWFKADRAPTGSERFFIYETAPTFTLSLGLRAGTAGNTRIQLYTDSPTDADPNISVDVPNAVVADQWVHVATTISSTDGTFSVVVNGGESLGGVSNSAGFSVTDLATFNDFHIGTYRSANGRFFPGLIDEFAIWNRLLTPQELAVVFTNRSHVNAAATGSNDGTSWANAYTSLQDALANAIPGQAIWVAEGSYYPDEGDGQTDNDRNASFDLKSGVKIYGGFPATGTPTFADRDPAAHATILSGDIDQNDGPDFANNDGNAYHVLIADGTDTEALLDGFTVEGGYADGIFPENAGGALYALGSAAPNIRNCLFTGNFADTGGALYLNQSASPVITDCIFKENRSGTRGGVAIISSSASPSFINCLFLGNDGGSEGGAISHLNASSTFNNCVFQGNQAQFTGGAIKNVNASPAITNCSFQGNAAGTFGGVLYNSNSSPTLTNCILWNNAEAGSTTAPGASVVAVNSSTPVYEHSLIHNQFPSGNGNLDGTDPANDPRFVAEVDPLAAPIATGGDLRLQASTPLLDRGSFVPGGPATDLAGRPRLSNTNVEPGAYELKILYVNGARTGGEFDGQSWFNAFNLLQEALKAAEAGDMLFVAEGTYYPDRSVNASDLFEDSDDRNATFALKSGVQLYGGFPTTISNPTFADRDPAAHATILSGDIDQNDGPDFTNNGGNAYNVLIADGTDAEARLDGFTITAGNANGSLSQGVGGGLYCAIAAGPVVSNCTFEGNSATFGGGAIYNFASSPSFTDCSFQSNFAVSSGGAIFNDGASPAITNCTFRGNSASSGGGAIFNFSSTPSLTNSTFQGNFSAANGGAVFNDDSSPVFINCSFQGNAASSPGGAVFNFFDASPSFINCIFWNNAQSGSTTTPTASVANDSGGNPTYAHSLVQNLNPAGTGNLDGTDPRNNPRFVAEVDPLAAPSLGGDLRLFLNSPALDAGLDSANSTETDLGGAPRFSGTIDLGAYEGFVDDPELLWPTDFDLDGRGYGLELIAGTDPEVADRDPLASLVVRPDGIPVLRFTRKPDTQVDYVVKVMRSPDLSPGSFEEIFRITRSGFGSDTEGGNQFFTGGGNTIVTFGDEDPPQGKAFYRLEAVFVE